MKLFLQYSAIAAIAFSATANAQTLISNITEGSLQVIASLTYGKETRTFKGVPFNTSAQPKAEVQTSIADQLIVPYLECEQSNGVSRVTYSHRTFNSMATTNWALDGAQNTNVIYTVTFPAVSTTWIDRQQQHASAQKCGYVEPPTVITLKAGGSVPANPQRDGYAFTDSSGGYSLRVVVKPIQIQ